MQQTRKWIAWKFIKQFQWNSIYNFEYYLKYELEHSSWTTYFGRLSRGSLCPQWQQKA